MTLGPFDLSSNLTVLKYNVSNRDGNTETYHKTQMGWKWIIREEFDTRYPTEIRSSQIIHKTRFHEDASLFKPFPMCPIGVDCTGSRKSYKFRGSSRRHFHGPIETIRTERVWKEKKKKTGLSVKPLIRWMKEYPSNHKGSLVSLGLTKCKRKRLGVGGHRDTPILLPTRHPPDNLVCQVNGQTRGCSWTPVSTGLGPVSVRRREW